MSTAEDYLDAVDLEEDLKADGRYISIGSIETGAYVEKLNVPALATKPSIRPDGDNVKVDDRWFMVSGIHDLTGTDRVVDDGMELSIINLFPLKISDQVIFTKIQARV